MALTVGELAATITVDDTEAEQGLNGFQTRLRAALTRITQRARTGGQDAGSALGEGLDEGASDGADTAGQSITGKLKGLALGAVGAGLGAALMGGIASAMEQQQITGKLAAQLGSTSAEAQKYGKAAGHLFANAVTEDFQGAADAIKATMSSGLLPPDATNAQIESISTKVSDLASTFDQDLGGVTNAVSQMLRTGLASSANEAFDVLTAGFQSSANKADDLVDTFNEYGVQFKKAGLDGATAVGLMNQAIQNGARDSDLAADAIKEFSIRAVDGSTTTAAGFQALGLNADDMAKKFGAGGKSATAALDTTLDRLRNMKDPVKQSAAATALFGTQAEDLGAALFAMDPSSAAQGLGKVGGAADRVGNSLRDNAATQVEQFKRKATQAFVDVLATKVLPILTTFGNWFQEHSGVAKVLAIGITALGVAFGVAAVAVWAMNSAMLANPIFWIIAGAAVAVAGLVYLIVTYWDQIQAATLAVWDWVVQKILWVKDAIVFAFLNFTLPGLLINYWSTIQSTAVSWWNAIVGWVKGIPGKIYNAFLNWTATGLIVKHWSAIKTATAVKALEMVAWVRGLPGRITNALGDLGGLLVGKGRDLVRGLFDGVKGMGGWLRSQLIGFAKNMIPGPIAKALGIHSPSRVMRDQIGRWIPAGIVEGVEDGAGAVDSTMRNLVSVPTGGQATAANVAASTASGAVAGRGSSPDVVRIGSDGSAFGDLIIATLRQKVAARGGNVQFVITGKAA
ncbi:phage tail tape measure protein [Streptomyces sp. NPDC059697]|uniref:phage tail tape measure protein n=1 Tax=Streptomyces sp. NPDC059697 TaxID=3346912 RepID=UPI0036CA1982